MCGALLCCNSKWQQIQLQLLNVCERASEMLPVPLPAWIPFSSRCDILMPDYAISGYGWIALHQGFAQARSFTILRHSERAGFITNHLNTDGIIIAVASALPFGQAGMPCPSAASHKLRDASIASHHEMG